jgi:hypothetical protein
MTTLPPNGLRQFLSLSLQLSLHASRIQSLKLLGEFGNGYLLIAILSPGSDGSLVAGWTASSSPSVRRRTLRWAVRGKDRGEQRASRIGSGPSYLALDVRFQDLQRLRFRKQSFASNQELETVGAIHGVEDAVDDRRQLYDGPLWVGSGLPRI